MTNGWRKGGVKGRAKEEDRRDGDATRKEGKT
jgi:hypothetical protein